MADGKHIFYHILYIYLLIYFFLLAEEQIIKRRLQIDGEVLISF